MVAMVWGVCDNRETLAGENHKERFFAGVANIPQKKKSSMDIYLMFLLSLKSMLNGGLLTI